MKKPQSKLARRDFLLAVGVGGVSTTLALVARENLEEPAEPAKTAPHGRGYRVTEHIRNYYRTAKI
jgi:hypothetical protein